MGASMRVYAFVIVAVALAVGWVLGDVGVRLAQAWIDANPLGLAIF